MMESAKLHALRALAPTCLTRHWYVPYAHYPSLIRALCALRAFTFINSCLTRLYLVLLQIPLCLSAPVLKKLDICLFQKKNRKENVKILLQNNCVNNGVTNGLKEKKEKQDAKQFYMVKQEKPLASSLWE